MATESLAAQMRAKRSELMVLAQTGRVTLHTRQYPLDAVNEAMDDLDAGRLQGRGILVPARSS